MSDRAQAVPTGMFRSMSRNAVDPAAAYIIASSLLSRLSIKCVIYSFHLQAFLPGLLPFTLDPRRTTPTSIYAIPFCSTILNMLASFLLFPAILAASVAASPLRRSSACAAFFNTGVDKVANFQLRAQYDDGSREALVLGDDGQSNSTVSILGTAATIPVSEGTNFTMTDSGITALAVGDVTTPKYSQTVSSGGFLSFTEAPDGGSGSPAEVYCELVSTDPNGSPYEYPILAVNSDADNFYVCQSTASVQRNVVYDASEASAEGYDFSSCQRAHVAMVQDY